MSHPQQLHTGTNKEILIASRDFRGLQMIRAEVPGILLNVIFYIFFIFSFSF